MLKIYDKLDDVPEALREHYELSAGKYVPKVSDDHPLVKHNATLLNEKKAADEKAAKLESDLQSARAGNLPRGQRAVSTADAELLEKVKAAGVTKPEEFDALKTERDGLKVTEAKRAKEDNIRALARAKGWDAEQAVTLLADEPTLPDFLIADKGGKKEVTAKIKKSDTEFENKPFDDVWNSTPKLKALESSLKPAGGREFITQAGGAANTGDEDLITKRNKEREAQREKSPNALMQKPAVREARA